MRQEIGSAREAIRTATTLRELRTAMQQLADKAQEALRLLADASEACEKGTEAQRAALAVRLRAYVR
jgi:methyl-accepting chemotaxis protein